MKVKDIVPGRKYVYFEYVSSSWKSRRIRLRHTVTVKAVAKSGIVHVEREVWKAMFPSDVGSSQQCGAIARGDVSYKKYPYKEIVNSRKLHPIDEDDVG